MLGVTIVWVLIVVTPTSAFVIDDLATEGQCDTLLKEFVNPQVDAKCYKVAKAR